MPDDIYEVIALAARYWFLLLMVLIAWRSYRWYSKDRKKFKRRLKLLPDAGYVGELVVVQGDDILKRGTCLPVSREGVLGYLRGNDISVPAGGVANRHLWYSFDDVDGLLVEPLRGRMIVADGKELIGRRMRAYLAHGSTLEVGQAVMRLRMFAGFEFAGETAASRLPLDEDDMLAEDINDKPPQDRVRRMHEIAAWQTMDEDPAEDEDFFLPDMSDDDIEDEDYIPPDDDSGPDAYITQDGANGFYPPVSDEGDEALAREDFIGEDDAETAKRVVWDKLFRGGKKP